MTLGATRAGSSERAISAEGGPDRAHLPLLQLDGITKRYGAVEALRDVSFVVPDGKVTALVGDNGAGKSTLIKAIAGSAPPDEGRFLFDGREVTLDTPHAATELGIATVYQDLALCDNLDVVANLHLGREHRRRGLRALSPVNELAMEREALTVLERLSVTLATARTPVAALSGGQRQSIAIARSMLGAPRLVILDEPTAALGVLQTRQVLDLIMRLRADGLAIILISHNLADIFEVADRIVVLRLGRHVATFDRSACTPDEVVAAITGAAGVGMEHEAVAS